MPNEETQPTLDMCGEPSRFTHLPGDGPYPWIELVEKYLNQRLVSPSHQRDITVWNTKKKRAWVDRLRMVNMNHAQPPIGAINLYTLADGSAGPVRFINDGLQRISTCASLYSHPKDYAMTSRDAETILGNCSALVQNRIYKDHITAGEDFVLVNQGTSLIAAERNKLYLVYAKNDRGKEIWPMWERILFEFHNGIKHMLVSYCRITEDQRGHKEYMERHSYQLFGLLNGKAVAKYGNGPELEKAVAAALKISSDAETKRNLEQLQRWSSTIERAWREKHPAGEYEKMYQSLARWCLACMAAHYRDQPNWWREFFVTLFERTGPRPSIELMEPDRFGRKKIHLNTDVSIFEKVCEAIGIKPIEEKIRVRPTTLLKEGFQHHHVDPFVDYGEGPTTPLPALENAAQNARKPI